MLAAHAQGNHKAAPKLHVVLHGLHGIILRSRPFSAAIAMVPWRRHFLKCKIHSVFEKSFFSIPWPDLFVFNPGIAHNDVSEETSRLWNALGHMLMLLITDLAGELSLWDIQIGCSAPDGHHLKNATLRREAFSEAWVPATPTDSTSTCLNWQHLACSERQRL